MNPVIARKIFCLGLIACLISPAITQATPLDETSEPTSLTLYAGTPRSAISTPDYVSYPTADQRLALNLEDLGFSKESTTGDPVLQKKLNKRTKMLKIHQLMGIATGVMMALALSQASGTGVKGEEGKAAREDHAKFGIATGVLYFTTASFSLFAPDVHEKKVSGRTKIHKALAFIHFPAMVATMYLGISDKKKLDRGEDASGLKPAAAGIAAVSYYTAMAVMIIPFGGK